MKRTIFFRFVTFLLAFTLLAAPAWALTPEQAAELLELLYIDDIPKEVLEQETVSDMLSALGDPYTEYFTPEEYKAFMASMSDTSLVGIGVVFSRTGLLIDENGLAIDQILEGSPAAKEIGRASCRERVCLYV